MLDGQLAGVAHYVVPSTVELEGPAVLLAGLSRDGHDAGIQRLFADFVRASVNQGCASMKDVPAVRVEPLRIRLGWSESRSGSGQRQVLASRGCCVRRSPDGLGWTARWAHEGAIDVYAYEADHAGRVPTGREETQLSDQLQTLVPAASGPEL